MANLKGLNACAMATEGDTIITLEVSRLSRSTHQLCEITNTIKEKMLRLVIVGSLAIDCRNGEIDPMSQAFLTMSGVFAELELSMIRARVKSGMRHAALKGKLIGRSQTTKDSIPATLMVLDALFGQRSSIRGVVFLLQRVYPKICVNEQAGAKMKVKRGGEQFYCSLPCVHSNIKSGRRSRAAAQPPCVSIYP